MARARIVAIDASAALAVPGVRLVMTAADLPQPVPRFGPQFDGPAGPRRRRDQVPRRAGGRRGRGDEGRGRGGRPPRAGRVRGAAGGRDARRRPRPRRPPRPGPGRSARTTRWPGPTSCKEHRVGWGDVDAAAAPTSSSTTPTRSRWSPTSPSSRTPSWPPPTATASPSGARSSTPTGCSGSWPRSLGLPLSKVRVLAPDPGGGFGGKQHAKYEPLVAFMALRAGRPVRLVLSLEETFQAVRRAAAEVRVRTGVRPGRHHRLRGHRRRLPHRRLRGHRRPRREQGQLRRRGALPHAGRPHRGPRRALAHRALHGLPRLRQSRRSTGPWSRTSTRPPGSWASTAWRSACATWPARARPSSPGTRRPTATGSRRCGGLPSSSAGTAHAAGTRPRHRRRAQVGAHHRPLLLDRPPPRRRQRRRVRGHLGHGPGRPHRASPRSRPTSWARRSTWVTVVMGDTAVVPYDQQTSASRSTVLMGNAVLAACRDIQAQLRAMAARIHGVAEARHRGGARRRPPARPRGPHPRGPRGRPGAPGRRAHRRRARPARRPSRTTRSAGAPAFFEFNCTAIEAEVDRETGDVTDRPPRHRVRRGQGPQPAPGAHAGRRRRHPGPRATPSWSTTSSMRRGRVRNLGAIDYRIPTSMDLPQEMVSRHDRERRTARGPTAPRA